MAAMPKRRRIRAALLRRAEADLRQGATQLDYVLAWVSPGGLISELATSLQEEMSESVSRSFLSFVVHRLAPDATERITTARRRSGDREIFDCQAKRPAAARSAGGAHEVGLEQAEVLAAQPA